MSRRTRPSKRPNTPDARFHSVTVQLFINRMMHAGKKSVATRVMYDSLTLAAERAKKEPLEVLEGAIKNVSPMIEVKPRRVGGATYQVPVEVRSTRRQALGIRWIITAARERNEKTMTERLSAELLDASNNRGNAVKKREDTHRMAEANRAFSHYRW